MKTQMIEKNGFPKPIGFIMIFLMISLICLAQCIFSQIVNANTTGNKFGFSGVEQETVIQVEEVMYDEFFR